MNDADAGWLAAAIEGEGHIRAELGCQEITITNTDTDFAKKAARLLGPRAKIYEYEPGGVRKKQYKVGLHTSREIVSCLEACIPHMASKVSLAKSVLEFCKLAHERKARQYTVTEDMVKEIIKLHNSGINYRSIGRRLGISGPSVAQILKGRVQRWRHLII